ncbi:hypothetical protein [Anaerosolibacter sp.]|uniref:hypothetical protein n=1 Tax=Anaerosolibacter sp. TaxID=1872527 RepID=UPI0039EE7C3F
MGGTVTQLWRFFIHIQQPLWTCKGSVGKEEIKIPGKLHSDLEAELFLWRPILAGKATMIEYREGAWTLDDILKINSLLTMQDDIEAANVPKLK